MALLKSNLKTNPLPLEDRVAQLRAELAAAIDARAEEIRATMPGVPFMVCRNILTRNSACQCEAYLRIKESDA
jgi:hypothetical protein